MAMTLSLYIILRRKGGGDRTLREKQMTFRENKMGLSRVDGRYDSLVTMFVHAISHLTHPVNPPGIG